METIAVVLTGSSGVGKTTLMNFLKWRYTTRSKRDNELLLAFVKANVCHFFCYVLLRTAYHFRCKPKQCKRIGNYYLTLHFLDSDFFNKILGLMIILDAFSLALVHLISSIKYALLFLLGGMRKAKCIIFIYDEYLLQALADYMHFKIRYKGFVAQAYKILFRIIYGLSIVEFEKFDRVYLCVGVMDTNKSVKQWITRERTRFVDPYLLTARTVTTLILTRNISRTIMNADTLVFVVKDARDYFTKMISSLNAVIPLRLIIGGPGNG